MVTDQGWLFRNEIRGESCNYGDAKRLGKKTSRSYRLKKHFFDRYAKEIKNRDMLPADLPDIREAYEDLGILLEN